MTYGKWTWVAAAVLAGALVAADGATGAVPAGRMAGDEGTAGGGMPATRPATQPASARHGGRRGLAKPWSEMHTLTPKQQDQIVRIREDESDMEKKLRQKERDDIEALLTPEQVTELRDLEDKTKETHKEKAANARKRREGATTRPGL